MKVKGMSGPHVIKSFKTLSNYLTLNPVIPKTRMKVAEFPCTFCSLKHGNDCFYLELRILPSVFSLLTKKAFLGLATWTPPILSVLK